MKLFTPLKIREIELKNRIVVSPMCEYSAKNGHPQTWHLVHLGSRAVGGASLVFTEATAVQEHGRISAADTGIYNDAHIASWKPVADFIRASGAVAGMQLAHAGRKASTAVPWQGGKPVPIGEGGWQIVGPSPLPFDNGYQTPRALSLSEIDDIVAAFRRAAERALAAGFEVIEIHGAHGYLLHEFLSPLSNIRTDEFGGSLENRMRLALRVTQAVREVWPARNPLFFRVSATDWQEGGWDLEQSIELARRLKPLGVDVIDVSSGGNLAHAKIPVGPGYQVPFAAAIRKQAEVPTTALGMITEPVQAETILSTEQADLVVLARELLRDPYWPRRAAQEMNFKLTPPVQYQRAWQANRVLELTENLAAGAVIFAVRVQPRASKDEIAGEMAGAIKIRLQAPALEGRANEALIEFLAQLLKRPKGAVRILSGERSRIKRLEIRGVTKQQIERLFVQDA